MSRSAILDKNQSYTFNKYFELTADPEDILAELGATFQKKGLQLPTLSDPLDFLPDLEKRLLQTLELVDLTSAIARRETLIAPILLAVCAQAHQPLKIEYAIDVNQWLQGTVDYLIPGRQNLLIIQAKQADLARGFVQLGAELLALDEWTQSTAPTLYGAVTSGDTWKFGCLQRAAKTLIQDIRLYAVPTDLQPLVSILLGIINDSAQAGEAMMNLGNPAQQKPTQSLKNSKTQEQLDIEETGMTGDGMFWMLDKPGTFRTKGRAIYKHKEYAQLVQRALGRGLGDFPKTLRDFYARSKWDHRVECYVLDKPPLSFRAFTQ